MSVAGSPVPFRWNLVAPDELGSLPAGTSTPLKSVVPRRRRHRGRPVVRRAGLAAEIHQFRAWLGRSDSPHDLIAVLAAIRPDLFTVVHGWIRVDSAGVTTLERRDDGQHQVVVDLDPPVVLREIVSRVCRAAATEAGS